MCATCGYSERHVSTQTPSSNSELRAKLKNKLHLVAGTKEVTASG